MNFPNVTEKNNLFKFSNGSKVERILIEKEAYELSQINDYIQREMQKLGFEKNIITISANRNTLKCILKIKTGWMIDFAPANSIASILGFEYFPYYAISEAKLTNLKTL